MTQPPRRSFLKITATVAAAVALPAVGAVNSGSTESSMASSIPFRPFGKRAEVKVSALAMGGHHLGDVKDAEAAATLVAAAIDGGITFFDNCWEYHIGRSENWMGRALVGKRDRAFLMTKVCTHGRSAELAMGMLEQSLARLQTDHLDLWQIHGVSFDNDPDLAYAKGGVIEALDKAKRQGKTRFVGFTGHKDPRIHYRMIEMGYAFDAVQMPLNPFDATFEALSFEKLVLPEAAKRGMAVLGMKPMGGTAEAVKKGIVSPEELLRYAMSLPGVTTTISGMDSQDVLKKNLAVAQGFAAMSSAEMEGLRKRCAAYAGDGRFEPYKVSMKFDNPQAREAHDYPLDAQQKEVKDMFENASGATPH